MARIHWFIQHRIWGTALFLAIMWSIFQVIFTLGAYPMKWIDAGTVMLQNSLHSILPVSPLSSLVIDGVIAGTGATILFLPQVILLFLTLSFLEQSGYLMSSAQLFDGIMRKIGLSGRSFVPLLMGFGCNVPAIMAAKRLDDSKAKIITCMMMPFVSCSARLPVYTLLIAAFFEAKWQGTILFSLYLLGIFLALLSGVVLKYALPNMPEAKQMEKEIRYKLPSFKKIVSHALHQSLHFLEKIGKVIFPLSILMWMLFSFPYHGNVPAPIDQSYAASIGHVIEPVFKPLGFDWHITTALLSGLIAKESIISTLGTLFSLSPGDNEGLIHSLQNDPSFHKTSALAMMVFILISAPCMATLVALKGALGLRWAIGSAISSTVIAWGIAFFTYQIAILWL